MKSSLATCLLAVLGLLALPRAGHAQILPQFQVQPLDGIVAVVEDNIVLRSELDQAIATVRDQFAESPTSLPPLGLLQHQVLDRLILQDLQVQRAGEMGIRATMDEVNRAVDGIAQQNGLSRNQMDAALAERGLSMAGFQQQIGDQILVEKLRQQVLQQQVRVSEGEIENLLSSPSFSAGEAHLAHISIDIPQGASAADIAGAQARANEVERALADGMDFTAAAIRYSDAPDALEGGDLGWRSLGEMAPEVARALADLQPGQTTATLRDASGFHILKLVERRGEGQVIVTEYHARHLAIRPNPLLDETQAEAKIKRLRSEIVDDGADFAELAKQESDDDSTASQGGDMGWFHLEAWGAVVAEQMQTLKDGEISQPFFAGGDWHIVQKLAEREEDRTTDALRARAREAIQNRKSEDVYGNYLRQLRAESYVEIRLPTAAGAGAP